MTANPYEFAGKRYLIAGATGLLGRAVSAELLRLGAQVTGVSRNPSAAAKRFPHIDWCGEPAQAQGAFEGYLNLAGAPIAARRWSAGRKQELLGSRVGPTKALLELARASEVKPQVFLAASAIGVYGPQDAQPVTETTAVSPNRFGEQLCAAAEQAADEFAGLGVRTIQARFAVVLAADAPAWRQLTMSLKAGVATYLGDGRQMFSWVHIDDVVGALLFLLANTTLSGAVNVASPTPVSQRQLAQALCDMGPAHLALRVPGSLMRLVYGELADELLLAGQAVLPAKLKQAGFQFQYPNLSAALPVLLRHGG